MDSPAGNGRMIVCKKCGEEKKHCAKGMCRICYSRHWKNSNPEKVKASSKKYYVANADIISAKTLLWQKLNREKTNAKNKRWRSRNPEYYKRRYKANPEIIKESARLWVLANPEKAMETARRWRLANKNKIKEDKRRYRKANRNRINERHRRRRHTKNENGGSYTIQEWRELVEQTGNRCLCCGRTDKPLTVDHVIPVSRGGSSDISNIQPLCLSCNSRKCDYHTTDYRKVGSYALAE